ncbi:hypothetical protein CAPTEDRAFT_108837 [Capitella teleta]|uniref:Gastrin/cholecystokinin type B receptor n=1 Tax=Capitella teleta TaxID=283909 RepID=R7TDE9_CAPTE|nr:hypothetical protein CAPTEDRAFT_108837 [Capitella teleta]|eukprot:ELT89517.1 hypothetical protein CAPTEDRAFT_108837 [Capitella teleta]
MSGFLWNDSFDNRVVLTEATFLPSPSPQNPDDTNTSSPPPQPLGGEIRIPLYCLIFILSLVGNILVIMTLVQNKKMRTVTNVFLLNLSVSDLLLTVFCMPFTLVPTLLRNFIFGQEMCILIRYIQAVTVAVSVFTLVSISLERYFAICQPLRSRSWQTLSHSYKTIAGVWVLCLGTMVPIAVYQKHIPLKGGRHKCIEVIILCCFCVGEISVIAHINSANLLSSCKNNYLGVSLAHIAERTYTIILDLMLLVLPLILMLAAYGLISWTLWNGMKVDMRSRQDIKELRHINQNEDPDTDDEHTRYETCQENGNRRYGTKKRHEVRQGMRQNNTERSLQAKRRVIKMLFVVVLEFFVCWTPMYVLQTWSLFDWDNAQKHVSPVTMNLIHLLAYASSCTNPITYCFMNQKFRKCFLMAFRCCPCVKTPFVDPGSFANSQRTGKASPVRPRQKHLAIFSKLFRSKTQGDEIKMRKYIMGEHGDDIDNGDTTNGQTDEV